jgi:farnesyl-diphosphate farnesyltransferase
MSAAIASRTGRLASTSAVERASLDADRRFCHAALQRVSRTFALNTRVLAGTFHEAVTVGYLLCRVADALEDSWPGRPTEMEARFAQLLAALGGDDAARDALAVTARERAANGADLALVAELPRVLRVFAALPAPHRAALTRGVTTLATGMSRYASRAAGRPADLPYLDTEAELDDYCWIVAGCVGVLLTELFAAGHGDGDAGVHARRLALAPVVGQALQLTNILLDWPNDIRRGRCYLPADWLAPLALAPRDLVIDDVRAAPERRDAAARVAARLELKARAALARVPDYLDLIPVRRVRYRLFCLWPALWALGSLNHARRDPEFPWGPRRPRLPRAEVWRAALGSTLAVHHAGMLRKLYAMTARPVSAIS